jgi:hypothetical protein
VKIRFALFHGKLFSYFSKPFWPVQQFELATSALSSGKNLGLEVQSKSVQIVSGSGHKNLQKCVEMGLVPAHTTMVIEST